jgi:hypothetical protein
MIEHKKKIMERNEKMRFALGDFKANGHQIKEK